ncbi:hypothetical protein SCHPADRAFT_593514 [Schizopora paradoxa]|uniref:Uncharacterized protein n=1 Tax=Schizopora paradoxa TaxID=27342 RepID=A0A0H2RBL5_9AGAM|nr:hypothetical protein SCHPADRAFT_593514 [Schizopora paradoxa]
MKIATSPHSSADGFADVRDAEHPGASDADTPNSAISRSSFMTSLNPDILLEIFEHGCSTQALIVPKETTVPALVLSQVCKSWRSLILAQSSLWSSFAWGKDIVEGNFEGIITANERFVDLWDLYLSRSGQALLDVSLLLYNHDMSEAREYLLDSIFSKQNRLKRFRLYCAEWTLPEGKTYRLNSAPRLEYLHFQISNDGDGFESVSPDKVIVVDMSGFSMLQEVSLSDDVFIQAQEIGMESLRNAYIWPKEVVGAGSLAPRSLATSTSGLFHFLNIAPRLQSISFLINRPDIVPRSSRSQRLLLSHLREGKVFMETGNTEALDSLLGNLEMPSLESMWLGFHDHFRWEGVRRRWHLTNGLALKTLTYLNLSSARFQNPVDEEDLRTILQCTPALEKLEISMDEMTSQFVLLLTLQPMENAAGNLCTRLESLSLMAPLAVHRISSKKIVDLISSRWRPPQENHTELPPVDTDSPGLTEVLLQLKLEVGGPLVTDLRFIEPLSSFIRQGLRLQLFIPIPWQ